MSKQQFKSNGINLFIHKKNLKNFFKILFLLFSKTLKKKKYLKRAEY